MQETQGGWWGFKPTAARQLFQFVQIFTEREGPLPGACVPSASPSLRLLLASW